MSHGGPEPQSICDLNQFFSPYDNPLEQSFRSRQVILRLRLRLRLGLGLGLGLRLGLGLVGLRLWLQCESHGLLDNLLNHCLPLLLGRGLIARLLRLEPRGRC